MANETKITADIGKFVDGVCNEFLTAHKDVDKVEYRYKGSTHKGYIKVTSAFGFANYFDVTDLDKGQICLMLSVIMCNGRPRRRVTDKEQIREIEKLFK